MKQLPVTNWILVMDADAIARSDTRFMLEQAGYKVCLAENGDEVIDCYKEAQKCGYPFDAVIVDLNAQGGSGKETLKRLLECDPGAKVIATSDTGTDVFYSDFKNRGFKSVLKKPLSSRILEQTMSSVINQEGRFL
jgi:DNA-binding NtrC family response regulator